MRLNKYLTQLTTRSAGVVSGQSFGSSVVSLPCITSMCSVQCFPGGHSLRSAFGSFFYPDPSPLLFFQNQCDRCLVPLAWGLMAGGRGLPAMGAQLCLGAVCAIGGSPWTSRAPTDIFRLTLGALCHLLQVFTLTTLSKFWFEISLNSCSPMGQPISCRRLLSVLSDTNWNFAIFRHVNPTLLRLQIAFPLSCALVFLASHFALFRRQAFVPIQYSGLPREILVLLENEKHDSPHGQSTLVLPELKLLHCFAVQATTHTLSKPTKSSPLLANNPHILMLSVKWWRSISHSKDGRVKIALSSSVSAAIFFFCKSRKECWDLLKPIDHDD